MINRDKVIFALDLCKYDPDPGMENKWEHSCKKCPYCWDKSGNFRMCNQMYVDAIKLLTEEVKPVEMYLNDYRCGACGFNVTKQHLFCARCGQKVKWR